MPKCQRICVAGTAAAVFRLPSAYNLRAPDGSFVREPVAGHLCTHYYKINLGGEGFILRGGSTR